MSKKMYIANQNFISNTQGMIKRGDVVNNPTARMIDKGLVREVKIIEPEIKEVKPRKKRRAKNADSETNTAD
jgi:hypothetical protein